MSAEPRFPSPRDGARWWHDAVGYSIYLRSFADTNGDGVGDLAGVTEHLDYLAHLGVDLLWITPFYPSPLADGGYDITEFCAVDPRYGDTTDLDRLIAAAHERGMRLVIDLVPNHTSIHHRWFEQARRDPTGPYRDFYVWRDPAPDGGPPNNWVSYFGGPAWTFDEASGQCYLHLFLADQPDLNWRNPAVQHEFARIVRFWLERGVDGFRIDVAQGVLKDAELRSNPQHGPWEPTAPRQQQWQAFEHLHDIGQPDVPVIYERWQEICATFEAVLIGETYVLDGATLAMLLNGGGLDAGFWFKLMHIDWDAGQIRAALEEPLRAVTDPRRIAWALSSFDEVRSASRFGGGDLGRRRSLALSTLLFGLPGLPFLYQGEELGLLEGVVPNDRRDDPVGNDVTESRDGSRTPMPWRPGPAFGFSTATDTWLPEGGRADSDTVSVQLRTSGSWVARYRALVRLRRENPAMRHAPVDWLDLGDDAVIGIGRADLAVLANVGERPVRVALTGAVEFNTHDDLEFHADGFTLDPAQAVVVRRPAARAAT